MTAIDGDGQIVPTAGAASSTGVASSELPIPDSKDRFDALMQMADVWITRRNNRYQVLLRISAGLWGIMAASIVYIRVRPSEWLVLSVLCFVVVIHVMIAKRLQRGNSSDMESAFHLIQQAEDIVGIKLQPSPASRHLTRERRWRSRRLQSIFAPSYWILPTIFLAILAHSLLGAPPSSEQAPKPGSMQTK